MKKIIFFILFIIFNTFFPLKVLADQSWENILREKFKELDVEGYGSAACMFLYDFENDGIPEFVLGRSGEANYFRVYKILQNNLVEMEGEISPSLYVYSYPNGIISSGSLDTENPTFYTYQLKGNKIEVISSNYDKNFYSKYEKFIHVGNTIEKILFSPLSNDPKEILEVAIKVYKILENQKDKIKLQSDNNKSDDNKIGFNFHVSNWDIANDSGDKIEISFGSNKSYKYQYNKGEIYHFLMIDGDIIPGKNVIIKDNYSLIPARLVSEKLGASVDWNSKTQSASIIKGSTSIKVIVGDKVAYVNDKVVSLTTSPILYDNKLFLPLRFLSENLNMQVDYLDNKDMFNILPIVSIETSLNKEPFIRDKMEADLYLSSFLKLSSLNVPKSKNYYDDLKENSTIYNALYIFNVKKEIGPYYIFYNQEKGNTFLLNKYTKEIFMIRSDMYGFFSERFTIENGFLNMFYAS